MNKKIFKVFLDDIRSPVTVYPEDRGWTTVRTAKAALQMLEKEIVKEISLDHDLGDGCLTGYDVLCQLEKMIVDGRVKSIPVFLVHSMNPVGAEKMKAAIKVIQSLIPPA